MCWRWKRWAIATSSSTTLARAQDSVFVMSSRPPGESRASRSKSSRWVAGPEIRQSWSQARNEFAPSLSGSPNIQAWMKLSPVPGNGCRRILNSTRNQQAHAAPEIMQIASFQQEFQKIYGRRPEIYRAPGRVNLIGEHTDYNEGFVMPAAINFYTWLAISPRSDSTVNIRSRAFDDLVTVTLNGDLRPRHAWSDYVVGIIDQIRRSGKKIAGADILIESEVPMGSGLSSSAAIEVAAAFSL